MYPVVELVSRYTGGWSPTEWLTMATWVIIAAFVTVEMVRICGDDPDRGATVRRDSRTAAAMAAGALVVGVAYGAIFAVLWSIVGGFAPTELVGFWQRHPVPAALCAFVAWDFSGWIYHLIGHRTRFGWAAHSPHHSGSHYDATVALRLTWMPWHGLAHHPLLALAGFRFELILGCLAVSNALQAIQHSSTLPRAPRWLAAVVMTPGAHRHHHGPDGARRNLGPVFTVWDRLAGTWCAPEVDPAPENRQVATHETVAPGAVRTQLAGWRQLLANTALHSGPSHSGPSHSGPQLTGTPLRPGHRRAEPTRPTPPVPPSGRTAGMGR